MQRVISQFSYLTLFTAIGVSCLSGAVIVHNSPDVTTYVENISPASTVTVTGGAATFTGLVHSNVLVSVTGGMAFFHGEIQNGATFNLSSGHTLIDTLKNKAQLNITGDAELTLMKAVGNSVTVDLSGSGTLLLGGDDIFGNVSALNTSGGTIRTQGNDLTFWTTNLTGTTIIDLGGVTGNVDLGNVSGPGEIVFTNWSPETAVCFDLSSEIVPQIQLAFEGVETMVVGNTVVPVPEPAMTAMVLLLAAGAMVYRRRR